MKTVKVFSVMLLAFLLIASTAVFAQTEKGEILLDADFSLHAQSLDIDDEWDTTTDNSTFDFEIQAGYMVIDNVEVGVVLEYENNSTDVENDSYTSENSNSSLLYGVFGRYFFMPDSKLRPFAGARVTLGSSTIESKGVDDVKHDMLVGGVSGGVVYFLNEHWGVEGSYHLSKVTLTDDDDHAYTDDMDGLGHSLTVGVVFSF
jgi:outer membrane protein W